MIPCEAMEQPRLAFLYEIYKRSNGDPHQGVTYDDLVEAQGFGETLTKRLQRDLQCEGLVDLNAVPRITDMGRTVINYEHRRSNRQTIGITCQGVRLMEDILAHLSYTEPPTPPASIRLC
jgi:hypothetical protein